MTMDFSDNLILLVGGAFALGLIVGMITGRLGKGGGTNKRDPRDFGVLVSSPEMHPEAVARLAERAEALRAKK